MRIFGSFLTLEEQNGDLSFIIVLKVVLQIARQQSVNL